MEVAPSSERVIENADRMLVVLGKIIAAGGSLVPDEFLRTERRAMRADGTKALGGKARKRQRIETLEARPRVLTPCLWTPNSPRATLFISFLNNIGDLSAGAGFKRGAPAPTQVPSFSM